MITPTFSPRRRLAALAGTLVLLACAVAALAPGTALASKCGDEVLNDWFDNGRIDRVYPLNCYEEAIDSIPADLRDYADAEDVITRALQAAGRGGGGPDDPSRNQPDDPAAPEPASEAVPDVSSDPSSLPIPLLVLGGMSLALLGAGGLGYLSRRRHADDDAALGDDDLAS